MDAIKGRGIDRHLLGLRLLLNKQERSDLFDDPLFQRSQTWKLSTSGLSEGDLFRGTGYVIVVPNLDITPFPHVALVVAK